MRPSVAVSSSRPPCSPVSGATLRAWLEDSLATARLCHEDMEGARWLGPYLPNVNPPLWELGHVAWFLERWCLRHPGWPDNDSLMPNADALYDSSRISHVARWYLPLPAPGKTLEYLDRVMQRTQQRLAQDDLGDWQYFLELAIYHLDMHNEAFLYTRQTLGYPNPFADTGIAGYAAEASVSPADVQLPGGRVVLGAARDEGFVFDNEKWAHEVEVQPFTIARCQTTNREFLAFVEEGGYLRRELWDEAGWRWRANAGRRHPGYWRKAGNQWESRVFDRWQPLDPELPVLHVNAYEAQAYCRWAQRRLPTEAEWQFAAATDLAVSRPRRHPWGDSAPEVGQANLQGSGPVAASALPAGDSAWGCRQMLGNVWEWTSSEFAPFPGFSPDPYAEYSQPWFGTHQVLRGGSFATTARLARNGFRNFYTPDRGDVFAGFRTCRSGD